MHPCNIKILRRNKTSKGFTLIEFVIYMAIGSIIFGFLVLSSLEVIYSGIKQRAISEVVYNAHVIFDSLEYSSRNAESISLPLRGDTDTSITFGFSDSLLNPTVFYLEDGAVYKTIGVGMPQALTTQKINVDSFEIVNILHGDGTNSLSIYFYLESSGGSNFSEYQFSEDFYSTFTLRK